jgi:hypothetical protein
VTRRPPIPLFILGIDTLQYILPKATQEGHLSLLKERAAWLQLSLYADDMAVFINPSKEDVYMTVEIMYCFNAVIGLRINTTKSLVAPIQCSQIVDLDAVLQDFHGERLSFPVRYLGLPITLGKLRMIHLQVSLDGAEKRVEGGKGSYRTCDVKFGGRRELVKTVLDSMPTYILTALKPPRKFYKELDRIRRCFLCAGNQQLQDGKWKVSWARVYHTTKLGCLGIRDHEKFGRALRNH